MMARPLQSSTDGMGAHPRDMDHPDHGSATSIVGIQHGPTRQMIGHDGRAQFGGGTKVALPAAEADGWGALTLLLARPMLCLAIEDTLRGDTYPWIHYSTEHHPPYRPMLAVEVLRTTWAHAGGF